MFLPKQEVDIFKYFVIYLVNIDTCHAALQNWFNLPFIHYFHEVYAFIIDIVISLFWQIYLYGFDWQQGKIFSLIGAGADVGGRISASCPANHLAFLWLVFSVVSYLNCCIVTLQLYSLTLKEKCFSSIITEIERARQ